MLLIMHDGLRISKLFLSIVDQLNPLKTQIIYVPSADFEENGIYFSPGYINLLKSLSREYIGKSAKFYRFLKKLGIIHFEIPDFDLSIEISKTLWVYNNRPIKEFFEKINATLRPKIHIQPLFNNPINVIVKSNVGRLTVTQFLENYDVEEIRDIDVENKDDVEMLSEIKNALLSSENIILFQLSPISFLILRMFEVFKKIAEEYRGHIIYVLPNKLTKHDVITLKKIAKVEDYAGLLKTLKDQIDIVIFDERDHPLLKNIQDLEITMYPISFKTHRKEELEESINDFFKVLEAVEG
ncbi:MAG: hypothetical protein ACP6IP_03875 [Candidatus Njordarchaeia archaeon]